MVQMQNLRIITQFKVVVLELNNIHKWQMLPFNNTLRRGLLKRMLFITGCNRHLHENVYMLILEIMTYSINYHFKNSTHVIKGYAIL